MYARGIEFVKPKGNNGHTRIADTFYKVPSSSEDANRANTVVVGSLLVQSTGGSNAGVDGASTADTTGTVGRKALGLAATVCDPIGRPLPRNQIAATESGTVTILPARGNVFRCLEDGDGGVISDANSKGTYASLVISAPSSLSDAQTFTPNPEAEIKIDSSSISGGTASNRMIRLLGADPAVQYKPGEPRAFLFEFTDEFSEAIS